jgi:UDP-N-acetylglucosamine 4-epimerase
MTPYERLKMQLKASPRTWLVTGVAGFIGSNLLETLLRFDQNVRGLDNFSAGYAKNLAEVQSLVTGAQWERFKFVQGDVRDRKVCRALCEGADVVLHQAALCSVPGSVADPLLAHEVNLTGSLNVLLAARDAKVKRVVYASSSAIYGDHPGLPKREEQPANPLSPYAATKYANELYADVFHRCYGLETIGLRYFNVFGPRQDPNGAYAAVIPKWIAAFLKGEPIYINGDGETTRDFCHIDNVVQANLLAAVGAGDKAVNRAYNIALNEQTSLNQLFRLLQTQLAAERPEVAQRQPIYQDFRAGDVRHSQADISQAANWLGYQPTHRLEDGLRAALNWYTRNLS